MDITIHAWDDEGNQIDVYHMEVDDEFFSRVKTGDEETIRGVIHRMVEHDNGEKMEKVTDPEKMDRIAAFYSNGVYSAVIVFVMYYCDFTVTLNILKGTEKPAVKF